MQSPSDRSVEAGRSAEGGRLGVSPACPASHQSRDGGRDLVQGQDLVGEARLGDGRGHAVDRRRGCVLGDDRAAVLLHGPGALARVHAHARQDDA